MPYKILHFAFCYFPVYGGMTTRLHNMLSDGKNLHHLYVPQAPNPYIPPEIQKMPSQDQFGNIMVKRRYFPQRGNRNLPVVDYIGDYLFYSKFAQSFCREAKNENVNIVYGHTPLPFGYAAMSYAKINTLPFIYEAHGLECDTIWQSSKRGIKEIYHRTFQSVILKNEKKIINSADAIIAQTEKIKNRIIVEYRVPHNKITVIPNGVDVHHFNAELFESKRSHIRKENNWEGKTVFLYSGLFDDINGIDFFIKALNKLPAEISEKIVVVFLGRGPLQGDVEYAAKKFKYVEYLGRKPYEEMPLYYSAADVFVIPRPSCLASETLMPMKLYEAMAMEKVVLVSDVKPMADAIQNGDLGFYYQKGDTDKFIGMIKHLAENHHKYKQMTSDARQKVVAECSWEKAHHSLSIIYDTIFRG